MQETMPAQPVQLNYTHDIAPSLAFVRKPLLVLAGISALLLSLNIMPLLSEIAGPQFPDPPRLLFIMVTVVGPVLMLVGVVRGWNGRGRGIVPLALGASAVVLYCFAGLWLSAIPQRWPSHTVLAYLVNAYMHAMLYLLLLWFILRPQSRQAIFGVSR